MKKHGALLVIVFAALAIAWSGQAHPTAKMTPASARATVTAFFRALESGRFGRACALLGTDLLAETGGPRCPAILRFGTPDPLRWRIEGVQATPGGIGVRVRLSQNDLHRVRMLTWLAVVTDQHGSEKIVETRLLA